MNPEVATPDLVTRNALVSVVRLMMRSRLIVTYRDRDVAFVWTLEICLRRTGRGVRRFKSSRRNQSFLSFTRC